MGKIKYGVLKSKAGLVFDAAYNSTIKSLVAQARHRCLCSLFLVDLLTAPGQKLRQEQKLLVDDILIELQTALWRGVDVRLLIGGSWDNLRIATLSETARARATELGIPCQWMTYQKGHQSHAKLVIADDYVLTGSHNWSVGALTDQVQDSILVESETLAAYLISIFEYQWKRATEGSTNV
jgi:phosphatidylserine/phosphatidylglycerophosphate/cardiolipin synthase-like enzyme